jgi:uncharacterized membrane protein YozB (DUF420 family)
MANRAPQRGRAPRVHAERVCRVVRLSGLLPELPTHLHINSVHFVGPPHVRTFYLWLLGTHTVLAMVSVPLILAALYFALRRRFESHRKVVQWTFPIWLYVSITGVAVYWLLYRVYPT